MRLETLISLKAKASIQIGALHTNTLTLSHPHIHLYTQTPTYTHTERKTQSQRFAVIEMLKALCIKFTLPVTCHRATPTRPSPYWTRSVLCPARELTFVSGMANSLTFTHIHTHMTRMRTQRTFRYFYHFHLFT